VISASILRDGGDHGFFLTRSLPVSAAAHCSPAVDTNAAFAIVLERSPAGTNQVVATNISAALLRCAPLALPSYPIAYRIIRNTSAPAFRASTASSDAVKVNHPLF
jgi:hypothetical protein